MRIELSRLFRGDIMSFTRSFITFFFTLSLFGCASDSSTSILGGSGGLNPGPNFPSKPDKSRHDSLSQLALASARLAEIELIKIKFLESDLSQNDPKNSCPSRQQVSLQNRDGETNKLFFVLDWRHCGEDSQRKGFDCIEATFDSAAHEKIAKLDIQNQRGSQPGWNRKPYCKNPSFYVSTEREIRITSASLEIIKSSSFDSTMFNWSDTFQLVSEKVADKKKFEVSFLSELSGSFVQGSNQQFQTHLFPTSVEINDTYSNNTDILEFTSPDEALEFQACGFPMANLSGELLVGATSEKIILSSLSLEKQGLTSPQINRKIDWPNCKEVKGLSHVLLMDQMFYNYRLEK